MIKTVKLVEVGARDGLQNEAQLVPTTIKAELIQKLVSAGLTHIEFGSFVSARKIPQLADSEQLFSLLQRRPNPAVHYSALVPNLQGLECAIRAGVQEIAVFGAASESFSQRNINCSMAESLLRFAAVIQAAKQKNIKVRGYISCAFACPYEGKIHPNIVVDYAQKLFALGCYEICLGDTIGVATANQVQSLIKRIQQKIPITNIAMHFHDTYGQGIANIFASLECGISSFDASISGLGGCPYAPGASGNVATEDVLYLLQNLGFATQINLSKLIQAGQFIDGYLQRETQSKVAKVAG